MYTIETAKLLLLQEYVPAVRDIVPELTDESTVIAYKQLLALSSVGASIAYLTNGIGTVFNLEPNGRELQKEYEARQDAQIKITGQQLTELCNEGVSISYIVGDSGQMFNRTPAGLELRQKQFEKRLYEMLNNNSISIMPEQATINKEQNHD
jgi:hypothetical protein